MEWLPVISPWEKKMMKKKMMKKLARKNDTAQQNNCNIPEEIAIEILSRLPIKALLRFSCVCKVWQSLISDPKFTLLSCRQIVTPIRPGYFGSDLCCYYVEETACRALDNPAVKLCNDEDTVRWSSMNILGSCNGLLLVSYYTNLYLWNPSTRQCTQMLSIHGYRGSSCFSDELSESSGLCYDSSADDYKAVFASQYPYVSVVSFKRKRWSTTTSQSHREMLCSGPTVNGLLHWVTTRDSTDLVIYFDPVKDEFVELPTPPRSNDGNRRTRILGLGALDGCLCMARFDLGSGTGDHEEVPANIEVLVMKEYGVAESWTSTFIVPNIVPNFMERSAFPGHLYHYYGYFVPLCFTKNREVLIAVGRGKLFLYNPVEMAHKDVPIPSNDCVIHVASSYTESLASPAAYGPDEDWIVKEPGALDLISFGAWGGCPYCDDWDCLYDLDQEENFSEEDEDVNDNWVCKGFWKKDNNQEKFADKVKARICYSSERKRRQEARQMVTGKSKLILRKNKQKKKQANGSKNLEAEDLHKQVLDFYVK